MKKKTKKAWACLSKYRKGEIDAVWAFPSDFDEADGGCNLLIFTTKREALNAGKYHDLKVVPCTITYQYEK